MTAETRFQEIPLSAVDLEDHTFVVSVPQDISRLAASMQEVGLLAPPWLRPRNGGRWQVVTGSKRLRAAVQLGWEHLTARTLPADTPDSHCLLASLYDNAFTRAFNLLEQAGYAARLLNHWDRQVVVAKFLPHLGLPSSQAHLDRLLALDTLEAPFKMLSARGRLGLTAAAFLAQWPPEDRSAALPFLAELPFSRSKQEEFLEGLDLLARREGTTPARILSREELQQYLGGAGANSSERAESVRRLLKLWISPRFSTTEKYFRSALSRLGLSNNPRIRLEAPPAFEGPDFHLELKFRDAPEFKKILEELNRLAQLPEFTALTNL